MITIDMAKAKDIAHAMRREMRTSEFAPLDIKATIPFEAEAAEAARQVVREKYNEMQVGIENASTADELKTVLGV